MSKFKRYLVLLMAAVMVVGMLAACGGDSSSSTTPTSGATSDTDAPPPATEGTPLVIAVAASFEEKWNPFLVENAYDHEVVDQIFTAVVGVNAENQVVPNGGEISYVENADGTVTYTVKLFEGQKFTDGTPRHHR